MTREKKVEILKAAHMSDDTVRRVMNEGMYEIYNLEDFERQFGQGLRVWCDILGLGDGVEDCERVTVDGSTYFVRIYDTE